MTKRGSRWLILATAAVVGLAMGLAEWSQGASWGQTASSVAIVLGYGIVVGLFQTRSETASLLAGKPVDERWVSINERALGVAAVIVAVVLVLAVVLVEFRGGDPFPYAWVAGTLAVAYIGGIVWFKWR